jgi:hypothetical protein
VADPTPRERAEAAWLEFCQRWRSERPLPPAPAVAYVAGHEYGAASRDAEIAAYERRTMMSERWITTAKLDLDLATARAAALTARVAALTAGLAHIEGMVLARSDGTARDVVVAVRALLAPQPTEPEGQP